jgi:hypothetical protein
MTDLRTRYLAGDCQPVRDALRASIDADSAAEDVAVATAVADEFVSRCIANLSRLYDALVTVRYEFDDPANAFVLHNSPSEDSVANFEKQMGRMPLIASRWYRWIKSVDFTQTYKQLTDRQCPLAGLGWNVLFIAQSLEKAQEQWAELCRQCEEDNRHLEAAGCPTRGAPPRALFTGGYASNNDCKGFDLPSFRFDDVFYNDGGGDQYFGDEIAHGFLRGGFPVLYAHESTLKVVRRLYGEPDREYLSKNLPTRYEAV